MPTHSPSSRVISKRDLQACTDIFAVLQLFQKLRYPVENVPVEMPLGEVDLPGSLRDGIMARYSVANVGGRSPGEPLLSVTLFELKVHKSEIIRGIAQTWTRRFPGEHFIVFTVKESSQQDKIRRLIFVNTRRLGEGTQVRIKLYKLLVERNNPTRHDLDTLNNIALSSGNMSAEEVYLLQCEAFNVEPLTNTFYREYAKLFQAALVRLKEDNANLEAFADSARLRTFTLRLFGRLMFLYFLQKKGALNDDLQFVKNKYEEAMQREENFYRSVLEPLFFEILNRPRPASQSHFGSVPYLNGGLFAQDEDDHVGVIEVANKLFALKDSEGLLYFLENHNFTIEEDTPLEVEVALDPEMLGKMFENLLEEAERGRSGTFYTPRPVVAFMCREALATYLAHEVQLPSETLGWLLDEAEAGEPVPNQQGQPLLNIHSLSQPLRERIDQALNQIRVLDPAVGSGAFLLGMLALLVGVRRALFRVVGLSVEQTMPLVGDWKRNFIRDCLYGVDIKREAIEIARLRFWLSLVVDARPFEMEPLPNLDFKLMTGDSLIETINGMAIYPTRPAEGLANQLSLIESVMQRQRQRLYKLKHEYFQPVSGRSARLIKQEILQTERAIMLEALREREQTLQEQLHYLSTSLVSTLSRTTNRTEIEARRRDIQVTQQAIADLEMGQPLPIFLYRLHFANVFEEKDGFDIVIANPPYVRHERIPQRTLRGLQEGYPTVQHGMADLYVYFYARALDLLHEGGTLAFISSNKFFRAGYGKGLRNLLTSQTQMQVVLDFGDAPVFDAAAYPCIVLTARDRPVSDCIYRGLTADNHIDLDKLSTTFESMAQELPQTQGVQALSSRKYDLALVQKPMQMGTPLGRYVNGKMYRGVVTGLNEAFVIDQATRERLTAGDPCSREVIKPFLRGRDIGRYTIKAPRLFLLYIGWRCVIADFPTIQCHLETFRDKLMARPETRQGRVPWFALSRYASDYYPSFECPKIVYPDIASQMEFSWDESGAYVGNTTYFIPTEKKYICALMNSRMMAYLYAFLSPQIRGGFFRFFGQYMKQLPIVEPSVEYQMRLEVLVNQLHALGNQGQGIAMLEQEVDAIIYQTYGLSDKDVAEIEGWHAERRTKLDRSQPGQQTISKRMMKA